MTKTIITAALLLGTMSGRAQEKVMNVVKADGTTTQTRVADLKQISFLTVDDGGQGMLVKTLDGATAAVLFETNPVVTVSSGKLVVKSSTARTVEFEIADIAEIQFGNPSDDSAISELKDFSVVIQDGGALLRDIPKGVTPRLFDLDGRSLPMPPSVDGELRLSRTALGSGIFIVKVGKFSAKIQF
ncbi:MAG: hypothetical protein K5945_03085 [Bacteroidaceae bacterium]|nr:hypothetical protein [Bacteroidaceae bacterium]